MRPSSILCRAQEVAQRDRAARATLENVRAVAEKAADAWGREALWAEQREKRQEQARLKADLASQDDQRSREQIDDSFSENPDRGFANS
jgi:hypothetical protein